MPEELAELARCANEAHKLAVESANKSLEHAIESGTALIAAKEQLAHGKWSLWLKKNFTASERTAQVYTQLARSNPQTSADSISDALEEIKRAERQAAGKGGRKPKVPVPLWEAAKKYAERLIDTGDETKITEFIRWFDQAFAPYR